MPDIVVDLDIELHAHLIEWAQEQRRPLPALVRDILGAAERVRANYDPGIDETTRLIRRCRDGGCGLCDEIEPLFAQGKTTSPIY